MNLGYLVVRFFFSILEIWYVELRVSRCISESPLEFEITRADCIIIGKGACDMYM